jgi:signal peptidase II
VENRGAAFGLMKDSRWLFMTVSTIAILIFVAYLYLGHAENNLYAVSLAMVISGGIGNMIDRMALGYVVDFIDFRLINFAVFNGADSFVCIGAGLLILALVKDLIAETKKSKASKAETVEDSKADEE